MFCRSFVPFYASITRFYVTLSDNFVSVMAHCLEKTALRSLKCLWTFIFNNFMSFQPHFHLVMKWRRAQQTTTMIKKKPFCACRDYLARVTMKIIKSKFIDYAQINNRNKKSITRLIKSIVSLIIRLHRKFVTSLWEYSGQRKTATSD